MENVVDVNESKLYKLSSSLLAILLQDHSSNKNIIWATDNYEELGLGYRLKDNISIFSITGRNESVIRPRICKSKEEQTKRIRDKAEVFTPSWVCNIQNNLVDEQWFGEKPNFNCETDKAWITNEDKITFDNVKEKTWEDYVLDVRLEITCGEAPYITSRYDSVSGDYIEPRNRIGLLDRKLRVISENTNSSGEWLEWAKKALQSIYAYEFQGDNLLIARENVLLAVEEYYEYLYGEKIQLEKLLIFADIISWNMWQMDGLKCVVPYSCKSEDIEQFTLFGIEYEHHECPGCKKNAITKHNGIYCKIKDWQLNKTTKFVTVATRGRKV